MTERDVLRIADALQSATKPNRYQAVPGLPEMVKELDSWVSDEYQWRYARPHNWSSLLTDLETSLDATGSSLATTLMSVRKRSRSEIRSVRKRLNQRREPPDESTRRQLQSICNSLKTELLKDASLVAAWTDVVSAEGPSRSLDLARLLLEMGELRGHPKHSLARHLQDVLGDDAAAVARAKGSELTTAEPDKAGETPAARIRLAERPLTELPRRGHAIVWMQYALAPPLQPLVLDVGKHVCLYNAEWLKSVVQGSKSHSKLLPQEILADPFALSMLIGHDESVRNDHVPRVAVRVDLGEVLIPEAERLARSSAEALIALAALHGADDSPWRLEDSYAMYIDGVSGPWSFSAPPVFTPSADQRIAVERDWTAEVMRKEAERWGTHFPLTDERFQQAAHLLIWLRNARETWAPGRLSLCDRIVERVAGWAGLGSVAQLVNGHIKLSWAIGCMRMEIANCGWAAAQPSDPMYPVGNRERLEWLNRVGAEIRSDPAIKLNQTPRSWSIDPRGVLQKLDWLSERVPDGSPVEERIALLRQRTATGQAAAVWADELMKEFEHLDARSRRIRNALVHGGPESDVVASAVVPFVETVAVDALYTAVDGRLKGIDLVNFFLDRRTEDIETLRALDGGANPLDVLWSEDNS